jgi:hypothetical protein
MNGIRPRLKLELGQKLNTLMKTKQYFDFSTIFIFFNFELNNNTNRFIVILFCRFASKIILFKKVL